MNSPKVSRCDRMGWNSILRKADGLEPVHAGRVCRQLLAASYLWSQDLLGRSKALALTPFSLQAGAALFQCQRTVLPGTGPVFISAAPVPGFSKWHPAAGCCAGLYGPLPASCRVSHVHWRIPHHLQEPAAGTPPEVSSMAWHCLLVAGRSWTVPVSLAQ